MHFVHICGLSGAGKRTLIHKLLTSKEMANQFDIGNQIELFGPLPATEFNSAGRPAEDMLRTTKQYNIHKWQFATHYVLTPVRDAFPDSVHKIILIWRPFDQIRETILQRGLPSNHPWNPSVDDLTKQWNELILPNFRDLKNHGFVVEVVDGSKLDYPILRPENVGFSNR